MSSKYWLKLYHEMIDDPKVARLNDSAYRRFIECLLLAGELDNEGLLPPLEDMAWRIRVPETALTQDMTRLALSGMVELQEYEGSERWFVSKFAERQAPSTSAQRVHEFRKRKRKEAKEKEENQIQITDSDTYIYGNVTSNVTPVTNRYIPVTNTHLYDDHIENTNSQELNDAIRDICIVVQGGDAAAPSDKILRMAHKIIDMGAADKILGFIPWWKGNGQYNGQPSFTSFNNQFQNYLDGVEREQGNGKEKLTPLQKIVRDLEAKQ